MDKHLHIITHDLPYPVLHGGLVDLYYQILALHAIGIKIHLHCFIRHGQTEQPELKKYCVSVDYYKRKTGLTGVSRSLPYIVSSRKSEALVDRLALDDHPILLGGVHCSAVLFEPKLTGRKFILRLYNVEHNYYRQLGKFERNTLRKMYFYFESALLKNYESRLAKKVPVASLSEDDVTFYQERFGAQSYFIPVFVPYRNVRFHEAKGMYGLYHGNLSVSENEEVVRWLLENVFDSLTLPFVIAGRNPSRDLTSFIEQRKNACLIANPSEAEMTDLIEKAQINILPSFNNTGVKLKLLHALFHGKHCVVNKAGVSGSRLEELCTIVEMAPEFQRKIKDLFEMDFDASQLTQRQNILGKVYNNEVNARDLMSLIS